MTSVYLPCRTVSLPHAASRGAASRGANVGDANVLDGHDEALFVDGDGVSVSVTCFADRWLVVVSDRNKMGSIASVSLQMPPAASRGTTVSEEQLASAVHIVPLLGAHSPEEPMTALLHAYACAIFAQCLQRQLPPRNLVLSVAQQIPEGSVHAQVQAVAQAVADLCQELQTE